MKANKWIVLAVLLLVVFAVVMKQHAKQAADLRPGAEESIAESAAPLAEEDAGAIASLPKEEETPADTAEPSPAAASKTQPPPSPATTTPRATEPPTPAQGERPASSSPAREPVERPKTSEPPAQAEERPEAPAEAADAAATPTAAQPGAETAAPAAQPRREKPLSGAKLAECLASGRPTLAEFGAGWCQLCRMMAPVIEEAAAKYKGKAHVVSVDVSVYPTLARQHGIRPIPTQIFFGSDGKEASRHSGYYPLTDIDRELAALGVTP